jgi:hypothetical protein
MAMKAWTVTGTVVLAMLGTATAFAQNGFHFTSPVDLTIGRESGILAAGQTLTDSILVLRPSQLSFTSKSPRTYFNLGYQPELELFDDNHHLNALNHAGILSFRFRLTSRLTFTATDEAMVTEDPSRSIAGSLMLLPRSGFKQNMAHAALDFASSSRNTVSFSFDNVAASAPFNATAVSDTGDVRSAATVSFSRTFVRKQILTGTYSVLNARAQFIGTAYEAELSPDLTLHLSAGLLKDSGKNYLVSAHLDKRVGGLWLNGGYHRFFSIFGTSVPGGIPIGNDLLLPDSVSRSNTYHVYTAGVSGKPSTRTLIEVRAAATRNNTGTPDHDINNTLGRFKISYGLTDRLRVYTDLQLYNQTFNVYVGDPINRSRYVAGMLFDISPKPNHVANYPGQTKPSQR